MIMKGIVQNFFLSSHPLRGKVDQRIRNLLSCGIHIASSIPEMRKYREENADISLVATMGALHTGHLELVRRAKQTNSKVVVSIFVNPTQFSQGEDLDKYPRQIESDLEMLTELGVDCAFIPTLPEMYPGSSLCHVEPSNFANISEGKARPDFFRGVATIVCKLFNIVQPSTTFFGQKDISQCLLVKQMVTDLNMPVDVLVCETVREADGLALSSRNAYLAPHERKVANILHKALVSAQQYCNDASSSGKLVTRDAIIENAQSVLQKEPLVTLVEYISVASHYDMTEIESYGCTTIEPSNTVSGAVISAAIRVGQVRLIDNLLVGRAADDILC